MKFGIVWFLLLAIGAGVEAAEGIEAEAMKREPATAKETLKLAAEHKGYPLMADYRWAYAGEWVSENIESSAGEPWNGKPTTYWSVVETFGGSELPVFWTERLRLANKDGALVMLGGGADPEWAEIVPAKLALGLKWGFRRGGKNDDLIDFDAEVMAKRPIETGSGTFEAWGIVYTPLDPSEETGISFLAWFAPDVGFVQLEDWRVSMEFGGVDVQGTKWIRTLHRIESTLVPRWLGEPSESRQVAMLPPHVTAPADKVSLFADFNDVGLGYIQLYLVNRTDTPFPLTNGEKDGPYIRQEYLNESGKWVRSQAFGSQGGSRLGLIRQWSNRNIVQELTVAAHSYRRLLGWRPLVGNRKKTRYSFYKGPEIHSNAGDDVIDNAQVVISQYDRLAHGGDDRKLKLPPSQEVAVLRQIMANGDPDGSWLEVQDAFRIAPKEFESAIKRKLMSKSESEREIGVSMLWGTSTNDFTDPEIPSLMEPLLHQRLDTWNRRLLEYIGEHPNGHAVAAKIAADPKYGNDVRLMARIYSQVRPLIKQLPVKCRVTSKPLDKDGKKRLTMTITNVSKEDVRFEYARPTEMFEFLVLVWPRTLVSEDDLFLTPRAGVEWYGPAAAGVQKKLVHMRPGEKHEVEAELSEYFDIAGRHGEVSTMIMIPGIHECPVACSGQIDLSGSNPLGIDLSQGDYYPDEREK